jgi:hypothetical protein
MAFHLRAEGFREMTMLYVRNHLRTTEIYIIFIPILPTTKKNEY